MTLQTKELQRNGVSNFMEELAEDILKDLLSQEKKTRFSKNAVQDIKALALNRLSGLIFLLNPNK